MPRDLSPQFIEGSAATVHMDAPWIDRTLRSHGPKFVHWRGMACPVGKIDPYDQRQPHPDHTGCSNGTVFTRAGCFRAFLSGNSKEKKAHITGWIDAATAQLTPPRFYEGSEDRVLLAQGDRLALEDEGILVTQSETVTCSLGPVDRASRPIAKVIDLMDWTGRVLREGADFSVRDGRIAWAGARPALDPRTGAAPVFSVRYLFSPSWYVAHFIHEVRVGQEQDGAGGIRSTLLPQSVIVQREYVYLSQKADPLATGGDPARQQDAPR